VSRKWVAVRQVARGGAIRVRARAEVFGLDPIAWTPDSLYKRVVRRERRAFSAEFKAEAVLAGNANWSTNRIAQFTDSSRGTPVVGRNVEPLLTPRFTSAHRVEVTPVSRLWVSVAGRYQSRAFLDNTSSPDRVLPDYYTLDAAARLSLGRTSLTVRGQNLGDTRKFGSGAVSSSGRVRYFILPARALFVTAAYDF
jgi:iron complex outermembrane receptor protein